MSTAAVISTYKLVSYILGVSKDFFNLYDCK